MVVGTETHKPNYLTVAGGKYQLTAFIWDWHLDVREIVANQTMAFHAERNERIPFLNGTKGQWKSDFIRINGNMIRGL